MIVKNEEATIERVLTCAKAICDELIVVDTGSTDRTVEIAERLGAKVFSFAWVNDFAAARNFSLAQCTGDWVLWLDADDLITPESQQHLLTLKNQHLSDSLDVVYLPYKYAFSPENPEVCILEVLRERLVRRAIEPRWQFPIHEQIEIQPEWRCLSMQDIFIDHRPAQGSETARISRNVGILKQAATGENPHPRMLYYYGLACLEMQQTEEAVAVFSRYFQVAQTQPVWEVYDAHMVLANHHKTAKNFQQAQAHCQQAIHLDHTRAKALNQMGILLCLQNRWAEALPFFGSSVQLTRPVGNFGNEHDEDYTWLPHHYLSLCLEKTGRLHEAVQMAVNSLPNHPHPDMVKQHLHGLIDQL